MEWVLLLMYLERPGYISGGLHKRGCEKLFLSSALSQRSRGRPRDRLGHQMACVEGAIPSGTRDFSRWQSDSSPARPSVVKQYSPCINSQGIEWA